VNHLLVINRNNPKKKYMASWNKQIVNQQPPLLAMAVDFHFDVR
jgi:hypothetical protein